MFGIQGKQWKSVSTALWCINAKKTTTKKPSNRDTQISMGTSPTCHEQVSVLWFSNMISLNIVERLIYNTLDNVISILLVWLHVQGPSHIFVSCDPFLWSHPVLSSEFGLAFCALYSSSLTRASESCPLFRLFYVVLFSTSLGFRYCFVSHRLLFTTLWHSYSHH